MIIGPTPPPDGGQRARNSMENSSDSNYLFGLVAVAVIVLAITAWVYLTRPVTETLPAESVPTTVTVPN